MYEVRYIYCTRNYMYMFKLTLELLLQELCWVYPFL